MGVFYTGKGDGGASLVNGKKFDKTCVEIESLGHIDELNSLLGLIRNQSILPRFREQLKLIQENLFIIQANIAIIMYGKKFKAPEFPQFKVKEAEELINSLEAEILPEKKFVIPGETAASAWFDYARAVCRRAERETFRLAKQKKITPPILSYLNRLSGLLFAFARFEAKQARVKESHPKYK